MEASGFAGGDSLLPGGKGTRPEHIMLEHRILCSLEIECRLLVFDTNVQIGG